jgi:hypothetical protein
MKSLGWPTHYPLMKQVLDFFSILAFFNHILRNELGQNFFLNLALLSRAMCTGVTYEGVGQRTWHDSWGWCVPNW